jgi:protease-4
MKVVSGSFQKALLGLSGLFLIGCSSLQIQVGPDSLRPLKEVVLEGSETGKVLVITVRGSISDAPKKEWLAESPGLVQEIVSQLRLAEKDSEVKAILLKIDSPGGTITACDILYRELLTLKEKKKLKIVAVMMNLAASGGYYLALPADRIYAHPHTVTGSVGALLIIPKFSGLMEKLGIGVEVSKSGRNKDMASFYRGTTAEEQEILDRMIEKAGRDFLELAARQRRLGEKEKAIIATARIFSAEEALSLNLIDRIGHLPEALKEAKKMAGLSEEAKVVVYRRQRHPNDTLYNTIGSDSPGPGASSLVRVPLLDAMEELQPGLYYLWAPGLNRR